MIDVLKAKLAARSAAIIKRRQERREAEQTEVFRNIGIEKPTTIRVRREDDDAFDGDIEAAISAEIDSGATS